MPGPLRVAVAQPKLVDGDLTATAASHAELVRRAGARLVVFPELSLTGYDLDAPAVALDDPCWDPLVAACRETGTTALAGAPVLGSDGERRIAVVAVGGDADDPDGGPRVAYEKTHLGSEEVACFTAGSGPAVLDVDGWRVGLAVCRDTGIAEHTSGTAALGVDLVAAGLVDGPDDVGVQRARALAIAQTCGAPVAFASAAGPTGPRHGYPQGAGRSFVQDAAGTVLASAGEDVGEVVTVELPAPPPSGQRAAAQAVHTGASSRSSSPLPRV